MAEHSDENSSKQCAPQLPCHYGYMAIGTGNRTLLATTRRQTNDAHSEVSYWLWGSQKANTGRSGPNQAAVLARSSGPGCML